MKYNQIVRLSAAHNTANFRSGSHALNEWLQEHALNSQRASTAQTYVITVDDTDDVVGYYALATGGVASDDAPNRILKGIARHAIPVILLARLAVHEEHQGRRLGRELLRDALIRVANAADEIGVRALLIHAKDDAARAFYLRQVEEFEESPVDPLQLFLLMKDLRKAIAG